MITAQDLLARVLHRDEDILIIDKPYGIAVHRGPKGGVTLDDFLPALTFGNPETPQLGHRLDRETTGCLVFGRHKAALQALGRIFQKGSAEKTYCALLAGRLPEKEGRIDMPLARRDHSNRSWWMRVDPKGDAAATRYLVLGEAEGMSFVLLWPETGRTHQLRVHCAELGAPIAGDRIYGGDRAKAIAPGLLLHALAIRLPGWGKRQPLLAEAPVPQDMSGLIKAIGLASALDSLPQKAGKTGA